MPKRRTIEELVQQANKRHDNKYTYANAEYDATGKRITVTCSTHGDFDINIAFHLRGGGCSKPGCAARFVTTADFIKRARAKHGEKFDYSQVVYLRGTLPVTIICPSHGAFEQSPNHHIATKTGCTRCGYEHLGDALRMTLSEFIAQANEVHSFRYEYKNADYKGTRESITITCRVHGDFSTTPNSHLCHTSGCPRCAGEQNGDRMRHTQDQFIQKVVAKYGDLYDYSKVEYLDQWTPVTISCRVEGHPAFVNTPYNHLSGSGCPICSAKKLSDSRRITQAEFIARAKRTHGDKYTYDKVDYSDSKIKVLITCPKHGDFMQKPAAHLIGNGCMKCGKGSVSRGQLEWLDFLQVQLGPQYPLQTAMSPEGEHRITSERLFRADGYCAATKTVYEYAGCFYHACTQCFPHRDMMTHLHKTFRELYEYTIARDAYIVAAGYKLKVVWEHEWRDFVRVIKRLQRRFREKRRVGKPEAYAAALLTN